MYSPPKNDTASTPSTPCIAVDCRMLGMSGIGVYLKNLVPEVLRRLPHCRFRLIGDVQKIAALPLPALGSGAREGAVDIRSCHARIYSVQEQALMPLTARGADLLWVPHYNIPLFTPVPLLVTVHDVAHLVLPEVTRNFARHSYARLLFAGVRRKAQTILCVSQFTADEFVRLVGTPHGTLRVVYNGVDMAWFAAEERSAGPGHWAKDTLRTGPKNEAGAGTDIESAEGVATPYFIAVGNLKAHKRIDLLCRAFAAVMDKLPHNLLLVGKHDGFISGGQSIADLMALAPSRIHCTGAIGTARLRTLVRGAEALVFPSSYEGFGLPPLEAMAAGVPVIAADIPPVREVCGEWATYFPANDEEKLATTLVEVSTASASFSTAHGGDSLEGARRHAANFTWQAAAEAVAQEMDRLCARSART